MPLLAGAAAAAASKPRKAVVPATTAAESAAPLRTVRRLCTVGSLTWAGWSMEVTISYLLAEGWVPVLGRHLGRTSKAAMSWAGTWAGPARRRCRGPALGPDQQGVDVSSRRPVDDAPATVRRRRIGDCDATRC